MTATDKAAEVVADMADDVAEQASDVAELARGADSGRLGLAFGALLLGAGIGGGVTFLLTRRKLELKYQQVAEEEIASMREHYLARTQALEGEAAKSELAEIIAEKGYTAPDAPAEGPPMAVQPPEAVTDAADDSEMAEDDVEGANGVKSRNVFRDQAARGPVAPDEWDWEAERSRRKDDVPYVIHRDERYEAEGYSTESLTYYEQDDVVCNDRDEIMDPATRDTLLGEDNLSKFGHGSGDPAIVYIQNDELEIVYEVVRSPNSYAEEVHGLSHGVSYGGNVERMRQRERDAVEED